MTTRGDVSKGNENESQFTIVEISTPVSPDNGQVTEIVNACLRKDGPQNIVLFTLAEADTAHQVFRQIENEYTRVENEGASAYGVRLAQTGFPPDKEFPGPEDPDFPELIDVIEKGIIFPHVEVELLKITRQSNHTELSGISYLGREFIPLEYSEDAFLSSLVGSVEHMISPSEGAGNDSEHYLTFLRTVGDSAWLTPICRRSFLDELRSEHTHTGMEHLGPLITELETRWKM